MNASTAQDLLELNQRLLVAIATGDWQTYDDLCDPTLTSFEPEARGYLVEGMEFHRFYFDLVTQASRTNTTMAAPHVRLVGDNGAVVSCVRLVQFVDAGGNPQTMRFEETRVWQRQNGRWQHVHFHRSTNT